MTVANYNRIVIVQNDSLGAALSTLVAFKLAGSKKEWMPKPVTNICIASPRVGTSGFRTAFQVRTNEVTRRTRTLLFPLLRHSILTLSVLDSFHFILFQQLEEDGLLRCLRIINSKDTVPALFPYSFGSAKLSLSFFPRLYKHVGINIRFKKKGYEIVHPSGLGPPPPSAQGLPLLRC